MRYGVVSFLLLVALLPAGGHAQSKLSRGSFDGLLLGARKAQSRHDYSAAARDYQRAVLIRSHLPELWANLGLMQDAIGDYSEAVRSFQRAWRLNPKLYVPKLFIGIDYLHLRNAHAALPFLRRAMAEKPSDPLAEQSLGRAYLLTGDYMGAARAFRRAVALNPKESTSWFELGIAALDLVDADSQRLSEHGGASPYADALYAQSLERQVRYGEAVTEEKRVLASDPDFPCAHARLGWFYLNQRNSAAAQEFQHGGKACGWAGLGQALLRAEAGEYALSFQLIEGVWRRDHGFTRANLAAFADGLSSARATGFSAWIGAQYSKEGTSHELLGLIAQAMRGVSVESIASAWAPKESGTTGGGLAAARADLQDGRYADCVADLPSVSSTRHAPGAATRKGQLLLSQCAFMTGDYLLAAAASDRVLYVSTDNQTALYWSVKANEKIAFLSLNRYEQMKPHSERSHLLLGDMYRQRQELESAEKQYKIAAALAPDDPAALYGLASADSEDSKEMQALSIAKTALRMSPADPEINLLTGEILVEEHEWASAGPYLKLSLHAKPQMLPHVHVLLGEVYEHTGQVEKAIIQLKLGLSSDEDGSVYYQLARLYGKTGNKAAEATAFAHVKLLESQRRKRAVIALQDSAGEASLRDIP